MKTFSEILAAIRGKPNKTIAVAMAEEEEALLAVSHAYEQGLADAVLVGNRDNILSVSDKIGLDISHFDIVHADGEQKAVVTAIQLVREHLADTLMKGKCSTAPLLRGVLDKTHGLRDGNILCHFAAFEIPTYHKLIFMSDAAMNIAPDLATKVAITENAVTTALNIGLTLPKVAIVTAVEKVNHHAMPCTVDAAIISKMADRGQIKKALIDGPLSLDNAISKKSCEVKGVESQVGGDADLLIMPDIEAANIFYKTIAYLGQAKSAGIIIGAKVPIILTSRADSEETKFLSIALGIISSIRKGI